MLVLASPLQPSPDVSALSPTSHVKRTGATGPVEAVNAVETQSGSNCPAVSTVVVTSTVTAPNDNKTPPGGAASTFDNFRESWVAGGFKKAIMSTGGAGVVKDGLFNCTANSSDKKVADAGEWGLEYLTGKKAEKIEITKDTKDWDDWVGKIGQHPMTVLTNDKPAKGLKPNRYYSLYSTVAKDKNSFNVWYTTHSDDTYEDNVATAIIKVDLAFDSV
ncbi:hypothetical protein L204_103539 [Cryptococcus depauperatus]